MMQPSDELVDAYITTMKKNASDTEFKSKAKIFIDQAKANEQGIVFNDLFMDEEKTYHWIEIFEEKKVS